MSKRTRLMMLLDEDAAQRELAEMNRGFKKQAPWKSVSDFLLEQCTGQYTALWMVARTLKVERPEDFGKHAISDLQQAGANRQALSALEGALASLGVLLKEKSNVEIVEVEGRTYEPFKTRRFYRLQEFTVELVRNKGEPYVLVNNTTKVPVSRTGNKRCTADKLYTMFSMFARGEDTAVIAFDVARTEDSVRSHLMRGGVLKRAEELDL